ncbi:MlaD family protein [Gordonia terrae]
MSGLRTVLGRVRRSDKLIGVVTLVVLVIVVVSVSTFYVVKPGRETITFTTRDAIALNRGDDVRVAGVSVGEVTGMHLERDRVRVDLAVEPGVKVGDRTRVEVRLLTAVGGYFVTVIPGGDPKDDRVIPADRVTVPYTIADTLQELPRITDNVSGTPIDETLAEIGQGFAGSPQSIQSIIDGLDSLATVVGTQRQQIRSIGDMVSNYSKTFNESRAFVFELIRKINIVVQAYDTHVVAYGYALKKLGDVVLKLRPFAVYYNNHNDQLYNAIVRTQASVQVIKDSMEQTIDNLLPARQRLQSLVGTVADGQKTGFVIDGSRLCFPIPGRQC